MIELGLSRIAKLRPARLTWKAIHIAGTNGKGSTAAYLSQLLHQYGVRVSRFNSPHLIDRWDCISIAEKTVDKHLFKQVERETRDQNVSHGIKATEFELLTATAFEIFNREKVAVGVVECGVGGRLDATNTLEANDVLVSVITNIDRDHENLLGKGLESIARHKAGIMKPDIPCVIDAQQNPLVLEILRQEAHRVGAPLHEVQPVSMATLRRLQRNFVGVPIEKESKALLQSHQRANLAVALRAWELAGVSLWRGRLPDPLPNLTSIIQHVHTNWQGRLQTSSIQSLTGRTTPVLLDGAHNFRSALALGRYVESQFRNPNNYPPVTWLLATSQGKDVRSIVSPMLRPGDNVVTCRFGPVDGMPWVQAESPQRLLDIAGVCMDNTGRRTGVPEDTSTTHTGQTYACNDNEHVWDALRIASNMAGPDGPLVIAGSLYLVSDTLRMLRDPPSSLEEDDYNTWVVRQVSELEKRRRGIFDAEDEES